MAGNIIVTTTVNKVTWQVDQTAYGKALKQVKSLKKEWEKVGASIAKRNNPAAGFLSAAQQAKLVSKRLAQTERAEQAKTTAHAIAMAKKEAAARAQISKVESARRKQAVAKLINNRTPEGQANYNSLRDHFKNLQKQNGPDLTNGAPKPKSTLIAPPRYTPSGIDNFGKPGQAHDPDLAKRQVEAMNRYHNAQKKQDNKASADAAKAAADRRKQIDKETADYRKALERREVVVGNAQRRLAAALGPQWAKKVKGFDTLSNTLKDRAGSISQYNSQIGEMIRQAKAGQAATMSLGDGMKSLRSSLVSVTAAYSAFNAASSILSSGQFFQSMNATMLMVSDTSEEAGKKMKFVEEQSYRLGLSLKVASQGYTQMAVNAKGVISDSDTNSLFKGLSEFSTASGADPVKYQRAITAIGQMLGKGQIMAEELKGQLAEALPGSMQIFVKAAQKHFKDDKIGVPELQDLMKDGKLLAKDILPLVAEGFAEMARKNGALNAQLKSNRVAMERMRQSWMKFQNEIFKGGFGDEMTKLFNMLADIMNTNGPAGRAIGEFAAGFVEAMRTIIAVAYDTFTIVTAIIEKFMVEMGVKKEDMGKIWNWAGMAVGVLVFANALNTVLKILTAIAGLKGALKVIGAIFAGGGEPDGPSRGRGGLRGVAGKAGLIGMITAWSALLGDYVFDEAKSYSDSTYGTDTTAGGNLKKNSLLGQGWDWMMNAGAAHEQDRLNYLNKNGLMPSGENPANGTPYIPPPQQVEGEIKITIDAGAMQDMIDQQIEMANMGNINLIAGVPSY